jgi:hypothetical protein
LEEVGKGGIVLHLFQPRGYVSDGDAYATRKDVTCNRGIGEIYTY